ncbi:amino acid transporter ANTL1-like isoform X2 [Sesamum indicum]|uniref:Amino acid transporter ANTL1-like isoform X2 n=1 Tax=Sesamum indicum TaxID=4182 RepID=A0A8M8V9H4_SESIN|nr:amino acid transporter ANTL1-like isoform X2 [Sesamum indicum]
MGFEKQNEAGSSTNSLRSFPREDTPLLSSHANPHSLSSQPKTFANVFIAIVGAGVLGLPYTFMRTGWLTSLIMIFFVAALTYRGMMLLIAARRKLEGSPHCAFSKISSFGDLGFAVCGSVGRFAVDSMIVLSQAGFCVGYLIFIGAMGVVMVQDALVFAKQMPLVEAFGTLSTFFYGLGVAVYSFEGVGMALPLESEMKDRSKFGKILGLTMIFIAAMYGGFGALGYFAFGDNTKDIITANMGKGLLSSLVQVGLCINLFFTFPLMMNPVYEVFERRFWDGKYCLWMRWMLVLAVSLVALFVPNFADFLSLVGSSTCCVLGFVLPALFHYLAFKDEMNWRRASADVGIIALGVFLGVTGTWYALLEIFSVKEQ